MKLKKKIDLNQLVIWSLVLFAFFVILHNLISGIFRVEEPIFFILSLITGAVFMVSTFLAIVMFFVRLGGKK